MDHIIQKLEKEIEKPNKLTTISISKENHAILKTLGQTSDSFNDVLTRLLKNNSLLESASRVGTRDKQILTVTNTSSPPPFSEEDNY